MNKIWTTALGGVLTAALLTGCGAQQGGHEGHGASSGAQQEARHGAAAADIAFAQGMIPHHQQALDMARLAPQRAGSPEVRDLAARIEAAQGPEITTLTGWLRNWGAPAGGGGHEHHGMPGVMTADQLAALAASGGAEFDRLFLELMIAHHQGAVEMARTELAEGTDPAARELATSITTAQQSEIEEMRGLLARR
ncbi:DUF305 domain-containing protein [Saccharopolyspora gloriosae]|uniref:Uncharacterized protein (DUF305 family) n=1 Tax=Saccharopolyspora gloriosae TaxID=455344 RepID=A0A840NDC1_9PSEU|nr:DUF305 domain-containing protein [Saccharopolyspora gloriosae]MBB5070326.1 uncharacterized protein (DUF305 family) [Saccharopolyspora gloriosae]